MSDPEDSEADSTQSQEAEPWHLARMVNALPDQGFATSISQIRQLSFDEYERTIEAEELFSRFGSKWPHTVAIHHASRFFADLERMENGRAKAGGIVNGADLDRVFGSLRVFADHVNDWITDAPTSTEGPITDAKTIAAATIPFALAQRIARGDAASLTAGEEGRVFVHLEDTPQVDARWVVVGALNATRAIADAELVAAEPSLLQAGGVIMGLRAEVVWGEPTLLRLPDASEGKMELAPRLIQWQMVEPVLTACAIAKTRTAPPATPPMVADPNMSAPAADAADSSPISPPPPVNTVAPPLDVVALLHEATSLAQTTEQRWSEALGAAVGDDIRELAGRIRSLLTSLGHLVIGEAEGGPVLPGIPLASEAANALSLTPDSQEEEVQHGLASLQVLSDLAQSVEVLSQPTGQNLDLVTGSVKTWWTQHGFNHVQYRAELATRVVSRGAPVGGLGRHEMIRQAQAAWTAGLPEAVIIYLMGALDPVDEEGGHLAGAYGTLATLANELAIGSNVSIDLVVVIARFWLDELLRRLSQGPGVGQEAGLPVT